MHKKHARLPLLLLCLLATVPALAESLPPSLAPLFAGPGWEGYAPVSHSRLPSGEITHGQYALIMAKEGHNILCIAERGADAPAFTLTVETDKAVHQGGRLPGLLIDTGGGALFISYPADADHPRESYTAFQTNGTWGPVETFIFPAPLADGRQPEIQFVGQDGILCRRILFSDGNDNLIETGAQEAVGPLAGDMRLAAFDIKAVAAHFADAIAAAIAAAE